MSSADRRTSAGPAPAPSGAVAKARELIDERYAERICLDDLAGAVGFSRFHLSRLFAQQVGLPPHAYQVAVRVARAQTLLTDGVPPARVAALTGFSDQSHLTRRFRTAIGMTPGRYAEAAGVRRERAADVLPAG